jgi:AbrB family looped-hinge helix DNA binding protein
MGEIFPGRKGDPMTITEMDAHGRVLLPPEIRTRLDLNAGDKLAIDHLRDGTIIITKPGKR